MKTPHPLLLKGYRLLLHLYPVNYHNTFAEEMEAVFIQAIIETPPDVISNLFVLARELRDIPVHAVRQRRDYWRYERTPQDVAQFDLLAARWITRIAGLLVWGFFFSIFAMQDHAIDIPAFSVLLIELICMVAAWRWEQIGGGLLVASAILFGLSLLPTWLLLTPNTVLTLVALTEIALFAIPLAIFGWLFIRNGRQAALIQQFAGSSCTKVTDDDKTT